MSTFYFTVHPSDMLRGRLIEGCHIMLVASAHWDDKRKRFKVRRPPADHIASITIDSGGFTAARKWGKYPWTADQYVDFIREESRDVALDFAASMDYACEREVNREALRTNRERIDAGIENEVELRDLAPNLPWLGVLQGNTLEERAYDIRIRRRIGLIAPYMGLGSVCGRSARDAAAVVRFYRDRLPNTVFHGFGFDCRTLDQGDGIALALATWDSYAWTWPKGKKGEPGRPHRMKGDGESYSQFTRRLGEHYYRTTIRPRLDRPRQISFDLTTSTSDDERIPA